MQKNYNMRILTSILMLFFSASTLVAQNVNIPDQALKDRLLEHDPVIDSNGDGEIQVSEAQAFSGDLELEGEFSLPAIYDATGLEAFVNITGLDLTSNAVSTIDLTPFTQLETLSLDFNWMDAVDISQNTNLVSVSLRSLNDLGQLNLNHPNLVYLDASATGLTTLDLSGAPNLVELKLGGNYLQNIDVSFLTDLEVLEVGSNNLSSIDVSSNTSLRILSVDYNPLNELVLNHPQLEELYMEGLGFTEMDLSVVPGLIKFFAPNNSFSEMDFTVTPNVESIVLNQNNFSAVDISMLNNLKSLHLANNPLTSVDVSSNTALEYIRVQNTDLTALDLSQNPNLIRIWFNNNPSLQYVNLKNGNSSNIDLQSGFQDVPSLQMVCVDDVAALQDSYLQQLSGLEVTLTDNCGFTPENTNIISGEAKFELSGDCEQTGATVLANTLVKVTNGNNSFSTMTNSNGEYLLYVGEGLNTSFIETGLPSYFVATPNSQDFSFIGYDNAGTANFCVSSTADVTDLNISIIPISAARPGFAATYKLVYENIGTTTSSGTVDFIYEEDKQSFMASTPAADASTTNSVSFDFTNLEPLQRGEVIIEMLTEQPPIVEGGDILNFSCGVAMATEDSTPEDNLRQWDQTVVNSYDPNDKQVLEGEEIGIAQAGEYLHYMVRFQNTGTASAVNVVVADTLSNQLNWDSMRMVSASHDYRVQITNDNFVEFIFEGIDLPHEAADEAGSNGYVVYKIKPVDGLQVGDIVHGMEAGIYFDFNPPIITNEADTEIVEQTASTEFFDFENSIKIHPNPSNGIVNISAGNGVELQKVEVYSVSGQKLLQEQAVSSIDIGNLPQGLYFVKVYSAEGAEVVRKIIKN